MVPHYSDQKLQILLVKFKSSVCWLKPQSCCLNPPILLAKWVCLKILDAFKDLMVYHHFSSKIAILVFREPKPPRHSPNHSPSRSEVPSPLSGWQRQFYLSRVRTPSDRSFSFTRGGRILPQPMTFLTGKITFKWIMLFHIEMAGYPPILDHTIWGCNLPVSARVKQTSKRPGVSRWRCPGK